MGGSCIWVTSIFTSSPNYAKLKTNLRLAVSRLKLLQKKKTELGRKAQKEIADSISENKIARAKMRVEQIIREDNLVEAMELLEMHCDLLLSNFGTFQQMKEVDEDLAEAVSSLIWVAPKLQTEVPELVIIRDLLISKYYGKDYGVACEYNAKGTAVSKKLMEKMSGQAPAKILVEKYLMEIAKVHGVNYVVDPQILDEAAG